MFSDLRRSGSGNSNSSILVCAMQGDPWRPLLSINDAHLAPGGGGLMQLTGATLNRQLAKEVTFPATVKLGPIVQRHDSDSDDEEEEETEEVDDEQEQKKKSAAKEKAKKRKQEEKEKRKKASASSSGGGGKLADLEANSTLTITLSKPYVDIAHERLITVLKALRSYGIGTGLTSAQMDAVFEVLVTRAEAFSAATEANTKSKVNQAVGGGGAGADEDVPNATSTAGAEGIMNIDPAEMMQAAAGQQCAQQ